MIKKSSTDENYELPAHAGRRNQFSIKTECTANGGHLTLRDNAPAGT